jgi:hypothetical protein
MRKLSDADLRKRLQRALDFAGGIYSQQDIIEMVKAGTMQAWHTENSLVLTQVVPYPQKRALNVFAVVGDMDEALSMHDEVEAFAREQGCEFMVMTGRKGWTRIMPNWGWQEAGVTMMYPIEEVR